MKLSGTQFRAIVKKLIREQMEQGSLTQYVTDTDEDPHKDAHADPTGATWDTGLEEVDESLDEYLEKK